MSLSSIDPLFNPEQFRNNGHALIDLLADHLNNQLSGQSPLMNWQPPLEAEQSWQQEMPDSSDMETHEFVSWLKQEVLPRNLAMFHPHSMAHQATPPLPIAALCDLVSSLSNQAMAIYETGPAATLIERQVINWLNNSIGWPDGAGVLTSGGSQANLTALLAARQHSDAQLWKQGMQYAHRLRILTSELSHYSIKRAAGIMGLGSESVIGVAVDKQGRICLDALQQAHETCHKNHEQIMAIVATAGCTPTGSIDPLQAIGEYCRKHALWLHIDAAHGASALLSEKHRAQLQGIALADSITWDAHKLLYMPATISAVLFRNSAASYSAFPEEDASYLFDDNNNTNNQDFDISHRTLECTKHMMGLKLLTAFKLYGRKGLAKLIDHSFALAQEFAYLISCTPGFALLMQPQTNIVCFRYLGSDCHSLPSTPEALNMLQTNIRKQLLHQSLFHLSQVKIGQDVWLRCTLMNPYSQQTQQQALLNTIADIAHKITNA